MSQSPNPGKFSLLSWETPNQWEQREGSASKLSPNITATRGSTRAPIQSPFFTGWGGRAVCGPAWGWGHLQVTLTPDPEIS